MLRIFICGVFCICSTLMHAQDDFNVQLLKDRNFNYSSDVSFLIHSGDQSEMLTGTYITTDVFQYLRLDTAEFYTYNNMQVKVSNTDKKLKLYKDVPVFDLSRLAFNEKSYDYFHFPTVLEVNDQGYTLQLRPIDSVNNTMGDTTLLLGLDYRIRSIIYELPQFNPYGIDAIELKFNNRVEQVDDSKHPLNYFDYVDGELTVKKQYTNYTILP